MAYLAQPRAEHVHVALVLPLRQDKGAAMTSPVSDIKSAGGPVWFGGGKLAADLTLPKLRLRWGGDGGSDGPFTAEERGAVWEHAARAADQALGQVRGLDQGSAADAAWAAADTLHAAAAALGSRILRGGGRCV